MDLEAFTAGTLIEQRVKVGELVAVGAVIGLIGAAGAAVAVTADAAALPTAASMNA